MSADHAAVHNWPRIQLCAAADPLQAAAAVPGSYRDANTVLPTIG